MAKKRKNARTKRKQKQQSKQKQNLIIAGVLLAIIGAFALFGISNRPESYYNERFDLEPIRGNPDAPVSIIEYGAFGCPACKAVDQSGVLEQMLEEYDGQIKIIFRDMPIIIPAYDFMSAQLGQCVLDQDNDLFWAFHDMMYTDAIQGSSTREELVANAGRLGADTDALNACYEAGTHVGTVRYDQQRGLDAGIRGTPTFFVNGELLYSFSPDAFRQAINKALNS